MESECQGSRPSSQEGWLLVDASGSKAKAVSQRKELIHLSGWMVWVWLLQSASILASTAGIFLHTNGWKEAGPSLQHTWAHDPSSLQSSLHLQLL